MCVCVCICNALCVKHQAEIKADWNSTKNLGYGLGKKHQMNERTAQWKAAGNKFAGGCYNNIYNASDYQQAENVAEMMTMTIMCARYGKEAMLADVNPYYVLGSVCVCVCVWMIMLCVSVWSLCVCVCQK